MFCVPALFTCGTGLYLCQNSAVFSCSCWNDGPVPAGFTITFLTYNFAVCVAVVTVAIWTKEAFLTLQLLVTLRCTVMKMIKPLSFTRSVISTQLVGSCGRIPVESQQSWARRNRKSSSTATGRVDRTHNLQAELSQFHDEGEWWDRSTWLPSWLGDRCDAHK